jgi:hypothetical protein
MERKGREGEKGNGVGNKSSQSIRKVAMRVCHAITPGSHEDWKRV